MTRLSLRDAIDRMCRNCIYDPLSRGTWRQQVGECSSSACPLHCVRPGPIAGKKDETDEAEAGREPEGGDSGSAREDSAVTTEETRDAA